MKVADLRRRAAVFCAVVLSFLFGAAAAAPTWEIVNVHPSGSASSRLAATTGLRQGGASDGHAGLWNGTAASL